MPHVVLMDTVQASGVRETEFGYLVATARVARPGIQVYLGDEVGMPEKPIYRVYRPPTEVFARDSMRSYAGKPMTNDHPAEDVTASNWRDLAVGQLGASVRREVVEPGEFVTVDLALMDADAIADYRAGKRELSAGYAAELVDEAGTTEDGQPFDGYIRNIRINHIALVDKARGGDRLRFGDSAALRDPEPTLITPKQPETAKDPHTMTTKTIFIDGAAVVTDDAGLALIGSLQKKLTDQATAHAAALSEALADKDKQIGTLTAELAQAKALQLSDAQIEAKAAARAELVATATRIHDADYTGKTEAEIRAIVCGVKLGDSVVKAMSADAIHGAFAVLAAGAGTTRPDPIAQSLRDGKPSGVKPAGANLDDAYAASLRDAHPSRRKQAA